MENQRSGLVRCAANSMTFATVKRLPLAGSFAIFRSPALPGMLRKSTAFLPRYQKFESISLQRRVRCEPSLSREFAFLGQEAAVFRGFPGRDERPGSAETRRRGNVRPKGSDISG